VPNQIKSSDDRAIYLVQPKFPPSTWGMDYVLSMSSFDAVFPPLGLLTLAALSPPEYSVTICDENAGEKVDYDAPAKIVGLTGYLLQKDRVFRHAAEFRKRGKTVVIGGPLANLLPDVCRNHCDVLFEGESEQTWPQFLREFGGGRWSDRYSEPEKVDMTTSPPPRLDLLKRRYIHGIVQCTRGCPFTCEFCEITVMFGRKVRFKPIEQVIREVDAWRRYGVPMVFFSDDNFVGNRAYAKELLKALIQWNSRQRRPMSFYTQTSIDMVRDEQLLCMLRDANFSDVFIGIETPRKASLEETKKTQNEKVDLVDAVHTIQSHNLFTSAGMIVGFDKDDPAIFDEQFEFCQKAGIPIIMNNTLNAAPKTPLIERLRREGRMLVDDWGQTDLEYELRPGRTNFRTLNLTAEELEQGQLKLISRLYSPEAFGERLYGNLSRFQNLRYRPEAVDYHQTRLFLRVAGFFFGTARRARGLFAKSLVHTLLRYPRRLVTVSNLLAIYAHILQLNRLTKV